MYSDMSAVNVRYVSLKMLRLGLVCLTDAITKTKIYN